MNATATSSSETQCVVISEGNEASTLPNLEEQGISLTFVHASDIRRITTQHFDAILIDADLGHTAFHCCKTLREKFAGVIVFVNGLRRASDELLAFELGANDYVARPMQPMILLARLRVHLRDSLRKKQRASDVLHVGELKVFRSTRRVTLGNLEIRLTTAEFDVLTVLAEHAGEPVSKEELLRRVRGHRNEGGERIVDIRVSRLRKKLLEHGHSSEIIKTVRGFGYQLVNDIRVTEPMSNVSA